MHRLLTREHDELLRRERSLLENVRVHLARLDAADEDLDVIKRSMQQLEELFLLVVVGEFNAGKTAFLNALIGAKLLTEGVTPTTTQINLLRYGERTRQEAVVDDTQTLYLPIDWLHEINLVDTPGTNAVIQRHQQLTEHFVPRSDLVLFVTSVERPFAESERLFMERIRQWGKKIVIVLNKVDLIESKEDQAQVVDFVRVNAQQLLGLTPEVFPISSRAALRAKLAAAQNGGVPDKLLWEQSQFGPLENYILETLNVGERIRLKLENPLGVATHMLDHYTEVVRQRQLVLKGDFHTLDVIDEQLDAYQADMRRDFKYQKSHVDNVLYEMAERGDRFFEETLRLGRVFDLMNSDKIRAEFERQVVADTGQQIERHVNELIDWMVEKDYRQWRDIIDYLNRRSTQNAERMVGQVSSEFEFNRQNILASVHREVQKVADTYDKTAEARKLSQEVQRAIVQTAAIEVGALGLGALLVALLQTTLLDITGLLGASAVAVMGFYVLPFRRSRLRIELRDRINDLRTQLDAALQRQFEKEQADSMQRIREAMGPYTRFVRVEREKLERLDKEMQNDRAEVNALRMSIEQAAEGEPVATMETTDEPG